MTKRVKSEHQKRLEKLAADLGGEQILKRLAAEYEKDGPIALEELAGQSRQDHR